MSAGLKILSPDGVLHTATLVFAQSETPASGRGPVVVCLPAMGAAAEYYRPFAERLAAAGALAVLLDLRGQGQSSARARRGDQFGYREILELDLPRAFRELREVFHGRRLYVAGHSLGGQLALFFAARYPGLLDGLVLVAAGSAYYRDWPTPWERLAARAVTTGISAVAALLPWYPGQALGFGGDQPRRLMRDWRRVAHHGVYRPEGSDFDYEGAARELALPILEVGIRRDPVAPPSAREALLARAPRAALVRVEVDGVLAHRPWKRHFSWARQPDEVFAAMRRLLT